MDWEKLVQQVKKELQITDDEVAARLAAVIADMNSGADSMSNLVELHYGVAKAELDPKRNPLLDLKNVALFTLKQQEYTEFVNDEQPFVDAKAKLQKITYLALRDLAEEGYALPETDFRQFKFGVHSSMLDRTMTHLEKEGYVKSQTNPATYTLTHAGSDRVGQIARSLDWWPIFLTDLTKSLTFWLIASKVAWSETQQYTKAFADLSAGQERLSHADAQELLNRIHSKVQPLLETMKKYELPPVELPDDISDLPQTSEELLNASVERMIARSKVTLNLPETLPRYVVHTINDLFPNETGKLTNFYVAPPSRDHARRIFREVLSILGETQSKKVVLGVKEWEALRQFAWSESGVSVFVYDQSANITPLGTCKEVFPGDRVVVFSFRDSPVLYEIMKSVNMVTPHATLFISVCRNYQDACVWNKASDMKIRIWPHDISTLQGQFSPASSLPYGRLKALARGARIDIARALSPSLTETSFGSVLSPRGQPAGIVVNKTRLYSDRLAQYQRAVRLCAANSFEAQPGAVLANSEWNLAGELAEILNVPLGKILDMSDGETRIVLEDTNYTADDFVRKMRDQQNVFVAFCDSDVTDTTVETLVLLKSLGLKLSALVLFDMLELPFGIRHALQLDSLVSLAEYAVLPATSSLVLKEMTYRNLVSKLVLDEAGRSSGTPSIHSYPRGSLNRALEEIQLSLEETADAIQ